MNQDNNHDEWLSLIEISGPFLAVPVLKKAFPQGLEAVDGRVRKYLRQAYDEWCEARDNDDPQLEELHRAWIREVLARGLEYDEKDSGELLKRGEAIPATLHIALPEHGVTLSPDYALIDGQKALLLIQTYPADTDLDAGISLQGWVATPAERLVQLCRTTGCRLGLVTNGERWLLIDAPVGSVVTYASWYARLWGQEPLTLQAFLTLLGIRRFFVDASEQLPALFDESLQHQEEVTDALGEQVRRAVEVLIQSLDKEDLNSGRTLLQDVAPTQLYEAGLTIMMRLVFLLSAEERGLLLMGEAAYEANYAISTLRMQLRKESDEVLERRHDAWARLLATFRAVYGGIEHEALRLPALGGSLFDPDRFPFLEGRPTGSSWRTDDARPLPIDNRTVLLLLEAIQQYQGRTLSYSALDVEQIGYVYEGLLARTVKRTDAVTVELVGGKGAKKTIYALNDLETLRERDEDAFACGLAGADALKRSEGAIRKDLARSVDAALTSHLLTACHGDEALRDRLFPVANLLRTDPWGYPLVYAQGAFIVTTGSDRRETGTHYTPKSLTEAIVAETLTAVAYIGPAEVKPREQWALKSPSELLDLKICDPSMGSGAFLVQACRWLAERLVEAWSLAEVSGKAVSVDGKVWDMDGAKEPLPCGVEARTVIARRLIAERCLYGVDLNPLAVELAKLSIWLVTLAKGRPFGFLDHNLRCGDSLLGIHRLDQLTELSMTPGSKGQQRLFGKNIEKAVREAIELRKRLREMPIRDIHDVEAMARLDAEARRRLEVPEQVAHAFIGEVFAAGGSDFALEAGLASLSIQAGQAVDGDRNAIKAIIDKGASALTITLPISKIRHPFHWPLEFPEVFSSNSAGFDAVIGNPPWGSTTDVVQRKWMDLAYETVGDYEAAIAFVERGIHIVSGCGVNGLVLPNTLLLNDSSSRMRANLSRFLKLMWVSDLTEFDIFKGASVRCCVLIFQCGKVTSGAFSYSRVPGFHLVQPFMIEQESLVFRKHWANLDAVEAKIPSGALKIDDVFFVKQGYKPYDKHALMKRMSEEEAKQIVEGKPWYADSQIDNTYVHELRGRDVAPYVVTWSGLWASYGPWVSNYLDPEWFSNERVLVREIVGKLPRLIIAAGFEEFSIHNPSIICIKPKSADSQTFLCFLELYLNSCLATKFISVISSKSSKGMFPKVLVKELKELPFPPREILDEVVLLDAERLLQEIRAGSNPEIADAFIEKIFESIPSSSTSRRATGKQILNNSVPGAISPQRKEGRHVLDQPCFDFDAAPALLTLVHSTTEQINQLGGTASDQILAWLEAHDGWFSKSAILKGCGAPPELWKVALTELLEGDFVVRRGEGDGSCYRAKL
jgi:type I restriction-modification system DNA methylase subunit